MFVSYSIFFKCSVLAQMKSGNPNPTKAITATASAIMAFLKKLGSQLIFESEFKTADPSTFCTQSKIVATVWRTGEYHKVIKNMSVDEYLRRSGDVGGYTRALTKIYRKTITGNQMKMWKVCVKFQPLPEARHLLSESGSWNGNAMRAICRESKNAGVQKR